MILLIPENRVCPGKVTRYPVTGINPMLWIKTVNEDFTVISIDGFIVTNQNRVNGIFKKFEFRSEVENEDISIEQINEIFAESEIRLIRDFSSVMNCDFYTFIWPVEYPVGFDPALKLIHSYTFDFAGDKLQIKTHKMISLSELENGIKQLRGYSFPNVKNLNSASTNVECHLANHTGNPWPGDIDTIIFDKRENRYKAIVEFKTHNIDSPIQREHIGKYGDQDWRRFNVLFDLIDNFNAKLEYRPKLFFVVWGTNPNSQNHANVKIDLIERNRVVESFLFPRPAYNEFSKELFDFILSKT